MTLQVDVVSPERILYSGEADMVIARTVGGGDIAFLSGHAPFVGALEVAELKIEREAGESEQVAVHGGFTVKVAEEVATPRSRAATAFCTAMTSTWSTPPIPMPKPSMYIEARNNVVSGPIVESSQRPSDMRAVPTIG